MAQPQAPWTGLQHRPPERRTARRAAVAIALVLEEIPLSDVAGMVARGEAVYDDSVTSGRAAVPAGTVPAGTVPAQGGAPEAGAGTERGDDPDLAAADRSTTS